MKNSTLAAQGGAGIAAIALLITLAQADSIQYSDLTNVNLELEDAAMAATAAIAGEIIEIELEMEGDTAIWEIDIVNEANQVVTVEINGQSGEVLSTNSDDEVVAPFVNAVSLSQAINIVMAVEQGAIVEAELENDDGNLIWEIESVGSDNQETKFLVNAETGEILI